MARQPVGPLLLGLVLLASCEEDPGYMGAFEEPSAVAVLQDGQEGPFREPVGYVASARGGRIAPLALKQGRFLNDDPTASFLRTNYLPTGRQRLISALATWSPDDETIDLFAADKAFGQLLRIHHVVGVDSSGAPLEEKASVGEPEFVDADGSGDTATMEEVEIKTGFTSTETWTAEFDGALWWVEGSRSGPQEKQVATGERFVADERAIAFTIEGEATPGDYFTIRTDNGLEEYDLGGRPLELAMAPDQSVLAVVVHDATLDRPVLRWWDPAEGSELGEVALPEDARPSRLAWHEDRLFVADLGRPAVWEVGVDAEPVEIPLPWPTMDVAPLIDDEAQLLYVAPATGRSIGLVDLSTGELVDTNPHREGVQVLELGSHVRGIEAIPLAYPWPQRDEDGVQLRGRSVAISLYSGRLVFAEEGTGCLVQDEYGPRTSPGAYGALDYDTNFNTSTGPWLERNETNDRHVQVSSCAGLAGPESWTLRYSRNLQAWTVEGSTSGVQERLAYEDQRYISDDGEISFTIRAGISPTEDGSRIQFSVISGVLEAFGDNDGSGKVDGLEPHVDLPADPVYFHYRVGGSDGGWDAVDDRPFVLVADEGSDMAARVEPPTGQLEVVWE